MHSERTLVVGLQRREVDEFKAWLQARGRRAWFTPNGAGAMRICEEAGPTHAIIDCQIDDMPAERLARILRRTTPDLKLTFLAAHRYEAEYLAGLEDLDRPCAELRPIDPLALLQETEDPLARNAGTGTQTLVLAGLVAEIVRNGETAALYLSSGLKRKILYFADGRLRFAASNHLDELLGRFLLDRGTVTQIDLDWARQLQLTEGVQQGEALQKIGVLRGTELRDCLQLQIREKFVCAFAPTDAVSWRIVVETPFNPHNDGYPICPVDVLTEALERYAGESLDRTPDPAAHHLRVRANTAEHLLHGIRQLVPDPALAALAAGRTLAAFQQSAGWSSTRTSAFLQALRLLGVGEVAPGLTPEDTATLQAVFSAEARAALDTVDGRIREIRKALGHARAHDPFALLRLPRTAGRAEIHEAADQLLQHFGAPAYAQGLPIDASMELAELLDTIRTARDMLSDPGQRERAQRRARLTMPVQALDANHAVRRYREGRQLLQEERWGEAAARLGEAAQMDGAHLEYRAWHAFALYRNASAPAEREQARRVLLRIAEHQPDFDEAYFLLGRLYALEGDNREACEQLRTALSFNPSNTDAAELLRALESAG